MRKMFNLLFSVLIAMSVTSSCTEVVKPIPYTYTKIFTGENSKTWKVTFLEFTEDGKVTDSFASDCFTDDSYIFHASAEHLYQVKLGSSPCSNDPDSDISDSWSYNGATATLTMIVPFLAPDIQLPFFVREVTSGKLETEIFLDSESKQSYRIHFTKADED